MYRDKKGVVQTIIQQHRVLGITAAAETFFFWLMAGATEPEAPPQSLAQDRRLPLILAKAAAGLPLDRTKPLPAALAEPA
jgi:hypothetical protein